MFRYIGMFAFAGIATVVTPQALSGLSLPKSAPAIENSAPAIEVAAQALPVCSGGDRASRRLTCIVDGDTGWQDGMKWRLTTQSGGVDTPEISKPECQAEVNAGYAARDRLRQIMAGGYSISQSGQDRYGRALVSIRLNDGRDAGTVLIDEGLAQPWPNNGNPWCVG